MKKPTKKLKVKSKNEPKLGIISKRINTELDRVFKKYNVENAIAFIRTESKILVCGHDVRLKLKDEKALVKSGIKLFEQIDPISTDKLNFLTDLVKSINKASTINRDLERAKVIEAESKLSTEDLKRLKDIRKKKMACVKKLDYENAAKYRHEEKQLLNIK